MNRNPVVQACWVLSLLFLVVAMAAPGVAGRPGTALFSEDEARALRLGPEEWGRSAPKVRDLGGGPAIELREPAWIETPQGRVVKTRPQLSLRVMFRGRDAAVDMSTLEVRGRKGIFSLSLSDRLRPYVKGESLVADGLAIPEGRFELEISIRDVAGRKTVESFRVQVEH